MITSYGLNINKFHTHGTLSLKWKFTAKQWNFSWVSTSFKSFWAGNRLIISQWFWNWASNVKVIKARVSTVNLVIKSLSYLIIWKQQFVLQCFSLSQMSIRTHLLKVHLWWFYVSPCYFAVDKEHACNGSSDDEQHCNNDSAIIPSEIRNNFTSQ